MDLHPAARELVDALVAQDDSRPRTQQAGPGFSSLGGCSRRVFHEIRLDEPCNADVERLPAIMGTAIHSAVERIWEPPGKLFLPEIGLSGTPDRIHDGVLDDYKTTTLKNVEWVRENGPSRQQRFQVHTYAYTANLERSTELARFPEDYPDGWKYPEIHTVRLIYIPRDGRSTDIHVHEEPYDPEVAEDAIEWFRGVMHAVHDEDAPAPEKDAAFCAKFCPFYGELCSGKTEIAKNEPELDDPWLAAAAAQYAEGIALEKRAKDLKKAAAGALEGVRGIAGGYRVGWIRRQPGEALDADAVRAQYAARGERVPTKQVAGSEYPSVRPVKKAS